MMSRAEESQRIDEAAGTATGQMAGMMQVTADPSQRDPRFFKQQREMIKAAGSGVAQAMKGAREGITQEKISTMKIREAQHQFDAQMRAQRAQKRADRIFQIGGAVLGGVAGAFVGMPIQGAMIGSALGGAASPNMSGAGAQAMDKELMGGGG